MSDARRFCLVLVVTSLVAAAPRLLAEELSPLERGRGSFDGVLVLTDGDIVEGRLSQSASGYVVDKSNGSLVVPFGRVQAVAESRAGAYRRLRSEINGESVDDHVGLARWCLTHGLYDQCKAELYAALVLNPDHANARTMLRRLDEIVNPREPRQVMRPSSVQTVDGFDQPPAQSLMQLSRDTALEFVQKVQPILINRCGNSRCHGSSPQDGLAHSGGFRIEHVRPGRGAHRLSTERNLAAVFAQINPDDPTGSPLLIEPSGDHRDDGLPVFGGPGGETHQKLVEQWVARAAAELVQQKAARDGLPSVVQRPTFARPEAETTVRSAGGIPVMSPRRASSDDRGMRSPQPLRGQALLNTILREERPDAFDPARFNRMMHGSR